MKKVNWNLVITILASIGAVASVIFIIVLANSMFLNGTTQTKIWGIVALSIAFVICSALVGVTATLYKANKIQKMQTNTLQDNETK